MKQKPLAHLWPRFVLAVFVAAQIVAIFPAAPAAAETPPTLSTFSSSNWSDIVNTSEVTGSISWSAGNTILVMGATEGGTFTLGTPTATGLSFSLITSINEGDANDAVIYAWSATAGSGGSGTVTATAPAGGTGMRGIAAYVFSGSAGIGNNSTLENSANKDFSLSRTYNNSAVVTMMGDWNAVNDTAVTANPSSGGTVQQATNTAQGTFFTVSWTDQGTAGSTNYGIASHTGTVDMSGISIEVRGSPAALEQEGYRWRADDGSESAATWLAAQDTNITRTSETTTRLRTLINATSGDPDSNQYQLEWRKVSGATDWRKVTTGTLTGQVNATVSTGTDDAQQITTTMATTGASIGASLDATTEWAGMRFQNIQVPKGATITSAFLSVTPTSNTEDEPLVTLYAEDADNSSTFTTGASNISNRTRTSGIAWSSTDLGATGTSYHNSSDIAAAVQTVIDRAGWSPGNSVTIIAQGGANSTRDLTIKSLENTGNTPPKLIINFNYPAAAMELSASSNIAASGANTTVQLAAPSGKSTSDFVAGRIQDDENPADAVNITSLDYTELEWSIKAVGSVVANGEVYEFRVTNNGTALDTYTVTPQWTIGTTNTAPSSPASAAQKKTDNTTISTGGWTNETSIKLTATVTDSDGGDTIKICAEVDPIATAFTSSSGDGDGCSTTGVSTGQTAEVTISGLSADTEYHWQIKAKDAAGAYSSWVTYGGNTENPPTNPAARDFGVDTSAPTGGTVYDGTVTDSDKAFSDSSLSSLSANWSGFSFTVSGIQKYEYSIGTTAGATDVKNWTDNSTTASVTATGLTLQTSQMYFVNVRAYDNAGNTVTRSSNGQLVAPSVTFSVSPSSITFDSLNAANSYTDSGKQTTLTTSTNAYGGYVVRLAASDNPRSGSFTIPDFTGGTYASPAAWGSSTGFGYSTSDSDIFPQSGSCAGGGTAPCYAPYSQTKPGDIVASHTANVTGTPITNQTVTISHRVTVAPSQVAANYATVLIYTVTPLY